ncbi:MAG TPA: rod shape-determining protein MreC [Candidatus Fimousia stercorigallinarum]|nr:rod shape-determining protein MreC [Candidatus Fimousia stercorigallinarum]
MKNRRKNRISPKHMLIIFVSLCLILMAVSTFAPSNLAVLSNIAGITIVPMQKGINKIGNSIIDRQNAMEENEELQKENEELTNLVNALRQENQNLSQDTYKLQRLEELYDLDKRYSDYKKTGANVISKGSGNWFDIFVIDKGSEDGMKVDMNVIAGNGLVGIIYEVSDHYSKVRSVINDTSMVSAMVLSTQDNCIVKGSTETMNKGYLEVVYLDKDSKVKEGDELVTSNISSKFMEGITIGTVTEVEESTDDLTKTARIEPVVDFQHLKEVLVIQEVKETVVLDETVKE